MMIMSSCEAGIVTILLFLLLSNNNQIKNYNK